MSYIPICKQRLNLLWLVPFRPFPPDHGGAVRIFNLIRHLSNYCNIHLFALSNQPSSPSDIARLEEYCQVVRLFTRTATVVPTLSQISPPAVYLDNVPALHSAIQDARIEHRYEIVQFEYPSMSQYRRHLDKAITILTEHDITFLSLYRRFLRDPWGYGKFRRFIGSILFGYYEWRHLRQFDAVVAMSYHDLSILNRFIKGPELAVIPNGVDIEQFSSVKPYSIEGTLLFVGNFNHPPNVDGIIHFVQTTWPKLNHCYPSLKLVIVGGSPPLDVQSLASAQIQICGWVPDLRPYYQQASAIIVPIRYGSGTRIKILEAFAAGVPVISTSVGAEGLDLQPDRHYLVANTAESFVIQIARLKSNPTLAFNLRSQARLLVENQHDWALIAEQQMDLYERLLRTRSQS